MEAVDAVVCQVLAKMANIQDEGITEETFADFIEVGNFVTTSSDGREIELCENGKNIPVTYAHFIIFWNLSTLTHTRHFSQVAQ